MNSSPIGIFDSGLGGLTVMKELVAALPNENLIYFGDTARVPYGNKSAETVIRYSLEIADFLMDQEIKLLVVACNTASAYALEPLQMKLKIPVVGVVNPGAYYAAAHSKNQRIAVLGTSATVESGAYQKAIRSYCPDAKVLAIPCPLFVPLVEENYLDRQAARLIVQDYLKPIQNQDTILLGCTHYPILKHLIQKELNGDVLIVDSATTCAAKVMEILREENIQNDKAGTKPLFFVSDDPKKFHQSGSQFLGFPIGEVIHVTEPAYY